MKKLTMAFAALSLCAASQATFFATTLFTTAADDISVPNVGESFVVLGDTYRADFTAATINAPRTFLDITWWQTFDTTIATSGSPAVAGYDSVTQVLSGRVRALQGTVQGSFDVALTEQILDQNGSGVGSSNPTFTWAGVATSEWTNFSFSSTTTFASLMTNGTVQKDDLLVSNDTGFQIEIQSIEQRYNPVPEPATMAILGFGALAMARKRRK